MLQEHTKIYLNKDLLTVSTDINIRKDIILADIIDWCHKTYFQNSRDLPNNILYVSDTDTENIIVPKDLLPSGQEGIPALKDILFDSMNIQTINAFRFDMDFEEDDPILTHNFYKIVIIGHINNIPNRLLNKIMHIYRNSLLVIFGDEVLTGVDQTPFHLRYLTNSNLQIKTEKSDECISTVKKVNTAINQMKRPMLKYSNLSSSSITTNVKHNISEDDIVNIIDTENTLSADNEKFQIIVPHRLFNDIISDTYIKHFGAEDIGITILRPYYLRMPYFFINKNPKFNQFILLEPMTKVMIVNIKNIGTRDKDTVFICDLMVLDGPYKDIEVKDVIINYSAYASLFNPDKHIFSYAIYDDPTLKPWDSTELYITPFPITTYEYAKMCTANRTYAFVETIILWSQDKHASDLYHIFCKTLNGIYVTQSDLFDYL